MVQPKRFDLKQFLIEKNVLIVGERCDISGMSIMLCDEIDYNNKIFIGDDCCIRASIILYKSSSKITIGNNVYIGPGTILECVESITMANNILISANCNIIDTNSHSLIAAERIDDTKDWQKGLRYKNWDVVKSSPVIIEDNCWLGLRSIVLKGVVLKEGTIVAAGAVVSKSYDSFSLLAGNPAQVIRKVS